MSELHAAQVAQAMPRAVWALYLMLALVVAAIAWAATTRVDEVTRAEARIVPDGREQVIASLEGGILRELAVREGQTVEAGQELAQLDPTRVESQQNESRARQLALKGALARLGAEARGLPLQFPPEVAAVRRIVDGETESYRARQRLLDEARAASQRSIDLLKRELATAETMAARGMLSEVEVMRLQRQVNELAQQEQERLNRFRQDASAERVRLQADLAQVDEQLAGRADVIRRTVLKSPVRGIVKNIRSVTIGGVVGAGAPVMEIVPVGAQVRIEARVKPSEIGFLRVGQPALVKLTAYDYNTYGGLEASVESIGPDALGDPDRPGGASATWYRVMLRAERSTLVERGEPLPLLPGMTATAEVRTGERSVLNFLLRPMLKSKEAFRER